MTDTTTSPTGSGGQPVHSSARRKLTDLTPKEIAKIGKAYGLVITGIVGTTFGRFMSTFVYGIAVLLLTLFVSTILTGILGMKSSLDFCLITSALWLFIMGSTYNLYLVNVPKLTGLITTDQFTEELHVFGTGLGLKFLWERYSTDDFIDLQADLVAEITRFVTKEGVGIKFPWSMQFTPFLAMLPLYVRTENKAISEGLAEVVETTFSGSVLGVKAKDMRHPTVLELIRKNLLRVLEGDPVLDMKGNEVAHVELRDSLGYPMEERFAIMVELATLGAPDYDPEFQELLLGSLKAAHIKKDAQKLARPGKDPTKWSGMSAERAIRQVMILNKEPGVTDESFTLDLTDRAAGAAGDAAQVLKTGAVLAQSLRNKTKGRRSGRGGSNPPATSTTPTGGHT